MIHVVMTGLIFTAVLWAFMLCQVSAEFHESMRTLIFPPGIGNKIQFLTGFGIPVSDLPEPYSITYGYVIKTSIDILNNVSVFHDPYVDYQKRNEKPSRWQIYELLQGVADGLGYNGRECLLRLVCETASSLLSRDTMVAEILHVLLTPSLTRDRSSTPGNYKEFDEAERLGKLNSKPCSSQYWSCKISLLDMFSVVAHETKNFPYIMK